MRSIAHASVLTCILMPSFYARADTYEITFSVDTEIANVFVYADEWNGKVYAWDLFPIPLGTVHAGSSSFGLGVHNVAAWAVIASHGTSGVALGINSSLSAPPDGQTFEFVFPNYAQGVVESNIRTLYDIAFNTPQAFYLTEFVLAVEDTLKTDFPTGTSMCTRSVPGPMWERRL